MLWTNKGSGRITQLRFAWNKSLTKYNTTCVQSVRSPSDWQVLYLSYAPTSVRIWHKAVFRVGPVTGLKPYTTSSSKNASWAFPFSGRLRHRAINPTPPKRVNAWGDNPETRGVVSSGGTHLNKPYSTQSQPVESAPPLDTMQRWRKACQVFAENEYRDRY